MDVIHKVDLRSYSTRTDPTGKLPAEARLIAESDASGSAAVVARTMRAMANELHPQWWMLWRTIPALRRRRDDD